MDLSNDFNTVTWGLIGFITLLTLWFHGPSYSSQTVRSAPSILTSIGIFGTFLGIALGLMAFDSSDIEASVPAMIDALGVAVWSSIAGIVGALSIKLRDSVQAIRQAAQRKQSTVTVEDLHTSMQVMGQQIGSLREESSGLLGELVNANRDYQARMVAANTDAFVKALSTVLTDFNRQIEVQYGENFIEFNHAIGRLLEWQKTYSGQLDAMLQAQKGSIDVMRHAGESYEQMIGYSREFNRVAGSLAELLSGLERQTGNLEGYLSGLSGLVGKASEGLPALGEYVTQLTDKLSQSIEQNNQSLTDILTRSARDIADTVERVTISLADSVNEAHGGLAERVEALTARSGQQMEQLDQAMEKELTAALQTFGYQLTALSEKFVNDYTPLTDRLRDVLAMAEKSTAGKARVS
ncbi:MAG: hypothetical protein RLZZ385_281 [Pseudomonadota bacterium]|jgi:DNA anti-recombination protein RmuC